MTVSKENKVIRQGMIDFPGVGSVKCYHMEDGSRLFDQEDLGKLFGFSSWEEFVKVAEGIPGIKKIFDEHPPITLTIEDEDKEVEKEDANDHR